MLRFFGLLCNRTYSDTGSLTGLEISLSVINYVEFNIQILCFLASH